MMKIYTKKGDRGYTTNLLGESIHKSDAMLNLQGTVDEVNAMVGHLRSLVVATNKDIDAELREVQYALFRVGADITTKFQTQKVLEEDVTFLEQRIDAMTEAFGVQSSFIYYSGHQSATYAHVVRSVVRRAERTFVKAFQGDIYPLDLQYLNRLADYFYALARYLNHGNGFDDEKMVIR